MNGLYKSLPKAFIAILITFLVATVSQSLQAENINENNTHKAVIITYTRIDDSSEGINEQAFNMHVKELQRKEYSILPIPEIIKKIRKNEILPNKTVGIFVNGNHRPTLNHAIENLSVNNIPFTIIYTPSLINEMNNDNIKKTSWEDIEAFESNRNIDFALKPEIKLEDINNIEDIRKGINKARLLSRMNTKIETNILIYPHEMTSQKLKQEAFNMKFDAAFGYDKGALHFKSDIYDAPQFIINANYSDVEHFQMILNALPLSIGDIIPENSALNKLPEHIGFTILDSKNKELYDLKCTLKGAEIKQEILGTARVEIRAEIPQSLEQTTLNCMMPAYSKNGEEPQWHWFSRLFTILPLPESETEAQD